MVAQGKPVPAIETRRLRLRGFTKDDLDALAAIYADPDVMRYMPGAKPVPRERVAASLGRMIAYWQEHGFGLWAVEDKESGRLIGRCSLVHLDSTPEIEVGYLFAADGWGKGYPTEAARAALDYGFTELDLDRIVAITRPENLASQHVLEKIGMCFERNACYYDMDVRYFSIPKATYRGEA
jgi:ribosomal-protein-alanine N-acetyltransferase